MHILAIEDDPAIRQLIHCALRRLGPAINCVPSAGGAYARFTCEHPDLIILDLMLWTREALDFLRRLRAHPLGTHVPVLLLSDCSAYVAGLPASTHQAVLTKPFTARELIESVVRLAPTTAILAGAEMATSTTPLSWAH